MARPCLKLKSSYFELKEGSKINKGDMTLIPILLAEGNLEEMNLPYYSETECSGEKYNPLVHEVHYRRKHRKSEVVQ